jgi:hypothetical protein
MALATPDEAIAEAQAAIETAQATRVRETLAVLRDLREDLLARIRHAGGLALEHLQALRDAIDAGVGRLRERLGAIVQDGQREAIRQGAGMVQETLATLELPVLVPDVTEGLLLATRDTTLGLVQNLSDSLRADLVREIQLGTLGIKDPFEVMEEIGKLLDAEGVTGYAHRAEAITRTEIGRVQSQATQARLEDAQRTMGDRVQKEWRHSGLARNARASHVAAHGQRRLVRETFSVGGVALMYPRDPAAPASATVNCRCICTPYVAPR